MDKDLLTLYETLGEHHHDSDTYSWDIGNWALNSKVQQIVDRVKLDSDRIFQASSPWEAAIFLANLQAREGFIILKDRLNIGQTIQTQKFKKIFRGQKAHYEDFEPSAWRNDAWNRAGVPPEAGANWLAAFALLMKLTTEHETNVSLQAWLYHGAAQHYQIPTELLDWTVDPFIAVWFAHWGTIKKGDRGRVFCVELENEDRAKILLPPPFVTRLIRQRGLFHYTSKANKAANHELYKRALTVEFPLAASWRIPKSLPYSRENELYRPDNFILDTRDAAKKIAQRLPHDYFQFLESDDEQLIITRIETARDTVLQDALNFLIGTYGKRFSLLNWEKMLGQWIVETNNYINWLCTLSSSTGQSLIVQQSVEKMETLNRDALYLYARWLSEQAPAVVRAERGQFAQDLLERLRTRYPDMMTGQNRGGSLH